MRQIAYAALLAFCAPEGAAAAESYDNCVGTISALPAVITKQGTWCLKADLSTAVVSGDAITVAANNVTIDCNGFKLGGLGAGMGTLTRGIQLGNRYNATIRNCSIRGFAVGVEAAGGGGHLVSDNRFDGNTVHAIRMDAPQTTIARNRILETGGTTQPLTVTAIELEDEAEVLDNTIDGVLPTASGANAAIRLQLNGLERSVVSGNRIHNVMTAESQVSYGVVSYGGWSVVSDNTILATINGGQFHPVMCEADFNSIVAVNNITSYASQIVSCDKSGNVGLSF